MGRFSISPFMVAVGLWIIGWFDLDPQRAMVREGAITIFLCTHFLVQAITRVGPRDR